MKSLGGPTAELATLIAAVSPAALGVGVLWLVAGCAGLRLHTGEAAQDCSSPLVKLWERRASNARVICGADPR